MGQYLSDLTEVSEVTGDAYLHVSIIIAGLPKDRKITLTNLGLGGGGVASTVAGKYRFKLDGSVQLWNPTQAKFHSLTISGAVGEETLSVSAGEV